MNEETKVEVTPYRHPRGYTTDEKADALITLDTCAGNVQRAAGLLDIPYDTLYAWSKGRGVSPEVLRCKAEKRRPMVERLRDVANQILDALPGKLEGASLKDCTIALGIVVDKMQILQGMPESITATATVTRSAEETIAALERLVENAAPGGEADRVSETVFRELTPRA